MLKVKFFNEETSFKPDKKGLIRDWINKIVINKGAKIKELNFIFCSDEYLKQVNIDYLDHHYYTDIITFDNAEEDGKLEGDIFISIDRIKENSAEYARSFNEELHRVMAHGVLHLLGYGDKSEEEANEMRRQEELSLSLFQALENE